MFSAHGLSRQASAERLIRPAPPHRRHLRPVMITSSASLALDAAPFASTPNAQLFRARVIGRLALADDHVVIVKRSQLAPRQAKPIAADDPIRELQVSAHVADRGGHPHIVDCLGVFLENGTTNLIMEHCTNGDLFQHLESYSDARLPQREALEILLQVARGLQFLHQCNIAHRDVSIENVLLDRDNNCKLCDFGLSMEADVVSTASVGKVHYMAPEVVSQTPHDPAKADIWSLGILFFILLTGSPLVKVAAAEANDYRAFAMLGGSRGVLKLWKMEGEFSAATLDLLDGMLQADPRERFESVTAILEHPAMLAAAARRLLDREQGGL